MKIALVRARYNPYGGAERFAVRAMQALSAQGADLTIIARSWNDSAEADSAMPSHLLRCDPFYIGSLWRDASFARSVQQLLKTKKFDLVQSHERIPGLPIYRAGDGVHAVWLDHRSVGLSPIKRVGLKLNPHHRWLLRTERKMFEHPELQAVICNAQMVRDEILARFNIAPDKLHVIPNGVDLERFHPSMRARYRDAMRQKLSIAADVPVFILVGSGFERKGVATALRALALTLPVCPAMLVIVGSDKRMAAYQDLAQQLGIAQLVRFVGEQRDPLPYYGLADFFLLPTIYDPFPNAALEALACGLPIIVSDACGAREAVFVREQAQSGWVCPILSSQTLTDQVFANVMQRLGQSLNATEQREVFRRAARTAAEAYSLPALATALQSLYQNLLSSGPS